LRFKLAGADALSSAPFQIDGEPFTTPIGSTCHPISNPNILKYDVLIFFQMEE
jgi:hypothetical protein